MCQAAGDTMDPDAISAEAREVIDQPLLTLVNPAVVLIAFHPSANQVLLTDSASVANRHVHSRHSTQRIRSGGVYCILVAFVLY